MSSKPGCAMVEMGDHSSCNTIIQNLTGCQVMGNDLKFRYIIRQQTCKRLAGSTEVTSK